ncbi:MAG: transcriptional [Beijerinckiaceae bacterium]|nr:MAG: transcriptional [Beijerinckiaceae bacterium]
MSNKRSASGKQAVPEAAQVLAGTALAGNGKPASSHVKKKRAAQRLRIMRAAIGEFAAKGYERTTMQDIANALEATSASLYYYFGSKEELLFVALDTVLSDLLAALSAAVERAGAAPLTAMRNLITAHVTFELADPTVGPLVNAHLYGPRYLVDMLSVGQQASLRRQQRAIYEVYRDVVRKGVATGLFRAQDVTLAVFDLLAIVQYPAVWFRSGGPLDIPAVAERQADIALRIVAETPEP